MSELIRGRYVVGLTWFSIVTKGDPGKQARQRAIKDGANWVAHKGLETSAGLAKLPRKTRPPKDGKFLALGRIAAARSAYGACFYVITLPVDAAGAAGAADSGAAGEIWTCGVVDGVPINQFEGVVAAAGVAPRYERFLQARGVKPEDCTLLGDATGVPGLDAEIERVTWAELVTDLPEDGEFAALQPSRPSLVDSVSPRMRAVLLSALGLVAVFYGWDEYQKYARHQQQLLHPVVHKDPAAEWTRVISGWAATKPAAGSQGLVKLLEAVSKAPVELVNWDLTRMDCKVNAANWVCVGVYDRTRAKALDPTTGGFIQARPAQWVVTPKSLDLLEVNFSVPLGASGADIAAMQPIAWHLEHTADKLQKASRAFAGATMNAFTPVQLAAPRKEDGTAMDVPAGISRLAESAVVLTGPMRSLDLDDVQQLPVSWTSLSMVFAPATVNRASLNYSAVMVEAKGNIYAKQ